MVVLRSPGAGVVVDGAATQWVFVGEVLELVLAMVGELPLTAMLIVRWSPSFVLGLPSCCVPLVRPSGVPPFVFNQISGSF